MQFKYTAFAFASLLASTMSAVKAAEGDVFKAPKVFQQIVPTSPFLITKTETVTWTQSPSITESTTVTPIPTTIESPVAA
ncbi:hypothetical protein DFP72DRAFT_895073 [Ephemerocybe angulata]|uniref:Uncharacterized protein n=1 Tax=Ephemerocybe angulata TaxID=980116 RepID=A0A8H6HZR8_9AGAR|nr:hypothetical protein DFP72DRAFT_895073 [Tulosesus angulatus]